jgi:4-hydroxybenzoate polyprenyltransferase
MSVVAYRPARLRRLAAAHLALARISNAPTVVTNVLAGAALVGHRQPEGRTAAAALAVLLLYVAGMYLNDLLDVDVDSRERPGRPLPSGAVSARSVALCATALIAAALGILATFGTVPLLGGIVLTGAILAYDAVHVRLSGSPLIVAACRALAYGVAGLAVSGSADLRLVVVALAAAAYVAGLSYLARNEMSLSAASLWPVPLLAWQSAWRSGPSTPRPSCTPGAAGASDARWRT